METGWLLDNGKLCIGAGCRGLILCPYTDQRAIRFARGEDAERMRYVLSRIGLVLTARHVQAVEHRWFPYPPPLEYDA